MKEHFVYLNIEHKKNFLDTNILNYNEPNEESFSSFKTWYEKVFLLT